MVMCHMLADTEEELVAMADHIGVARRWHQYAGTFKSHFDIALSKRALAVAAGAVEITWRRAGEMQRLRRIKFRQQELDRQYNEQLAVGWLREIESLSRMT
jgi:NRPS condensation-like uncharacterized protein